jgi:copper chaperone CopZ
VSVAVKKVNGVDSVKVSLNQGNAEIHFKPESTATYADVRSGVEKNGFSVRDTQVRARGKLQQSNEQLQFVVSGSGETFTVSSADAALLQKLKQNVGHELILGATVPAPQKDKKQDKLLIKSIVEGGE